MSNVKHWINKAGFSLINRFTIFFFGFASFFILVRFLSIADFGIYVLYTTIFTFLELGRSGFIQNGFIKYYLDEKFDKKEVASSSLILNVGLTIISSALLYSFSWYLGDLYKSKELTSMLQVYCVSSILLIPFTQLNYYQCAIADFKQTCILSLIRYGAYFLMIVIVYFFLPNTGLIEFAQLQALSILIGTVTSIVMIFKMGFSKKISCNWPLTKTLFDFGKYIFGTGLTSFLTRSVDQFMIGYYISSEAVATYNVAGRFLSFFEIPITSISQVYYHKFAQCTNSSDFKQTTGKLYEKSVGLMMATILPFILMLFVFPSFFISILAGEKYIDAVPILQIFVALNLIKPLGTQTGTVLEIAGKPKIIFYALLTSVIINIIANYFLIQIDGPFGGYIGAAIASVISTISFMALAINALYQESNVKMSTVLLHSYEAYKLGLDMCITQIKNRLSK